MDELGRVHGAPSDRIGAQTKLPHLTKESRRDVEARRRRRGCSADANGLAITDDVHGDVGSGVVADADDHSIRVRRVAWGRYGRLETASDGGQQRHGEHGRASSDVDRVVRHMLRVPLADPDGFANGVRQCMIYRVRALMSAVVTLAILYACGTKYVASRYPARAMEISGAQMCLSVVHTTTVRESREWSHHACRRARRMRHVSCTVGPVDDRASPTQMAPAFLYSGRVETLDASTLRDPVTMIPSVREATCAR